jgi:hypothetical protein
VRARTLLVNAARGLAKTHGERLAKTSTQSFASRAALWSFVLTFAPK